MTHARRILQGVLLSAVAALIAGVGLIAGSATADAAPSTATLHGFNLPWVKAEFALTEAKVTYDPTAGNLRVTLTHRAPLPRGAELGESIDVTSTSHYAMSSSQSDGVHIYSSVDAKGARQTYFYTTKNGPQSDRGPVAVQVNGASTTYTIDSPTIRALGLHYFSASTSDGRQCESTCMPSGTIPEQRLPF